MKIGFLFPGQGSQAVGMGKDLYENYEGYRKVYQKVDEVTGLNLEDITFCSTDEVLEQTKNTQISILTMSLAILELLKEEGIEAQVSMGLSLGEYAALIYSKALSIEEGVKIVQKRGELMQELCPKGEWAMAAVLGLEAKTVEEICNNIQTGFIAPANYNCPGQIVISGEKRAIEEAIIKAKEMGAKKVMELKTSGPFHTKMLEKASKELKKELENNVTIHEFQSTVIKNIDGKAYEKNEKDVTSILASHIISPVKLEKGIQTMLEMGVDTFVEIGPGKALSGFVKRTNKEVTILNINNIESFENAKQVLKQVKNV